MTVDPRHLRRTIAVANGKGGVGKTSVATQLAGLFADAGYSTLLIDLDPQGNAGNDLGYLPAQLSDEGQGLNLAVQQGETPKPLTGVRPNLDVVAGGEHLHDMAEVLQARARRGKDDGNDLVKAIAAIAGKYEITFIDCPPGHEVLQGAALAAARWVLIPTKTDDGSRAGLREIARRFEVARRTNPDLELLGVVLFGVNSSAKRTQQQARANLAEDLGSPDYVFESTIRHVEATAVEARGRGQLVHELEAAAASAPKWYERFKNGATAGEDAVHSRTATALATDYQNLSQEVLARIQNASNSQAASA